MKKNLLILSGLALCTLQAIAQIPTAAKAKKWDVKYSFGFSVNTPAENDLTGIGTSFHNHIPWNLAVERSLFKNFTSGISVNKRGFEGTFFTQKQKFSTTGFSPVLLYNLKDIIIIGAGPSVYFIRHKDYNVNSVRVYKMSKIGFELTSSFRFPQKSRFYTHADAGYCYTGKIEKFEFCDVTAKPDNDVLFYYARNVKMNYAYFGAGIGYKF